MTRARQTPALSLVILALTCSPAVALLNCSATAGGANIGDNAAGGAGGTSTSGTGSQNGGAGQEQEHEDDGIHIGGASGGGESGIGQGCATSSTEATLLPLNMFIAVDKSSSMSAGTKWDSAKTAFTHFFEDPAASSLRVALRFWPDDQPAPTPTAPQPILCNDNIDTDCGSDVVAACQRPDVDIGPLSDPAQQQALIDAFHAHQPAGDTPTWAALKGATRWCASYVLQTNKTEKAVVVLVTDGEPTSCDQDSAHIAKLADLAYQGAGVLTFAVGLAGSNQAVMNTIAKGGHTGQAFMIGSGNVAADLLAALKKIQGSTVACSFKVPDAPPGETLDLDKVNVEYTPGSGAMPSTIGKVSSYIACGQKGGWYYDDPHEPTSITLCPASCAAIQSDNGARIKIVLGCSTQPA